MKKIFLDEYKSESGYINYRRLIGEEIHFIYDDIEDTLIVTNYINYRVYFLYKNTSFDMSITDFKDCKLGRVVGKFGVFKFSIGQEVTVNRGRLKIIDRKHFKCGELLPNNKISISEYWYKVECLECGYIYWVFQSNLVKKQGCNFCLNRVISTGVNDISTTNPDLCIYFKDKNITKTNASRAGAKVDMICPHCLKERVYRIADLTEKGYLPCECRDKVGYPEKFFLNVLKQLNIDFMWQYTRKHAKWCNYKMYDFYIPKFNMIVEIHGAQHPGTKYYKKDAFKSSYDVGKSDIEKQELAIKNGIENYIIIDFSKSSKEFGKSAITDKLSEYFDFTCISWEDAHNEATSNYIKLASELYCSGISIPKIATNMRLATNTIVSYLHKGNKIGWCKYSRNGANKPVAVMRKDSEIARFNSIKELCEKSFDALGFSISACTARKYIQNQEEYFDCKFVLID